jgi:hypothetical protein
MSKRYYLGPIIGDGTEENPFRPKVALYSVQWSCPIASLENGHPAQMRAISEVEADDHSALLADPELTDVTAG